MRGRKGEAQLQACSHCGALSHRFLIRFLCPVWLQLHAAGRSSTIRTESLTAGYPCSLGSATTALRVGFEFVEPSHLGCCCFWLSHRLVRYSNFPATHLTSVSALLRCASLSSRDHTRYSGLRRCIVSNQDSTRPQGTTSSPPTSFSRL
jgi:hypothetical protein